MIKKFVIGLGINEKLTKSGPLSPLLLLPFNSLNFVSEQIKHVYIIMLYVSHYDFNNG